VLHRLVSSADVFVTNLREDALARLGLDPATLCELNPRLVYAKGGGFSASGPLAGLPCQDTVGMAYGGLMDLTSSTGEPNYPPGALSDVLTGTMLASAVMAGLVQRATTGRGGVVGATQTQSLLWLQLLPVGMAGSIGATMPRFSPAEPANPLFHVYPAADGWISIACIMPSQWPPAARALGLEHLLQDERFATWGGVLANAKELAAIIASTTVHRTKAEWWTVLREHDVWSAPVNGMHDVVVDEHLRHDAYLPEYPDGFVAPRAPFEVGDWRQTTATAASYGQHTDEVLTELGLAEDELEALRVEGTIW
jgi:crotonobetainyl-CoA:carnitine CoA-transferase CaiB-like acyl-CoA transferase